jgi:hypothetical protein
MIRGQDRYEKYEQERKNQEQARTKKQQYHSPLSGIVVPVFIIASRFCLSLLKYKYTAPVVFLSLHRQEATTVLYC